MAQVIWDASKFFANLKALGAKFDHACEQGVGKAGLALMNDCLTEDPTVPKKTGFLRGSGSVFAETNLVATSPSGRAGGSPLTSPEWGPSPKGLAVARVGFNTPYAMRVHESRTMKFTEPSAGDKWMESKMSRHGEQYINTAGKTVAKLLGML